MSASRNRSIHGTKGPGGAKRDSDLLDPLRRVELYATVMTLFVLAVVGTDLGMGFYLIHRGGDLAPRLTPMLTIAGIRLAFLLPLILLWRYSRRAARDVRLPVYLAALLQVGLMYSLTWFDADDLARWQTGQDWHFVWLCVFVLLFPMMVIAPRWLHAGVALLSVLAVFVWNMARRGMGLAPMDAGDVGFLTTNGLLVAAIAMAASHGLARLGKVLSEAHDEAQDLGSYKLIKLLGRGGMGEVWRGEHQMLARPAAIKLIKPSAFPGEADEILLRFEREARATAQLTSAHTVSIFDFGHTTSGEFFYVMELLDGMDLETMVKRSGPLPAIRVVYLLRQVCSSLSEAHTRGMIHRDIKPANIFVCRNGMNQDFVKVLDFGLVMHHRPTDPAQAIRLTQQGMVNGTPEYMSPEQIMDKKSIDQRSDIYSLGCVAYWCLTGGTVFQASDTTKLLRKHLEEQPEPLTATSTCKDMPMELNEVLMRCLAKDPDARPQNALELANLLGKVPMKQRWTQSKALAWWQSYENGREAN